MRGIGLTPKLPVEFVLYNLPVDDQLAAPGMPVPPLFRKNEYRDLSMVNREETGFCRKFCWSLSAGIGRT